MELTTVNRSRKRLDCSDVGEIGDEELASSAMTGTRGMGTNAAMEEEEGNLSLDDWPSLLLQ